MPRSLTLAHNGFFIGFDGRGVIRDLYWPHLGRWNHLNGNAIRFALWDGHRLWWLDDDGWEVRFPTNDVPDKGAITFRNNEIGVRIELEASMDLSGNQCNLVWRCHDHTGHSRRMKFFVAENLRLLENDIGDAVLYDPDGDIMIHYNGPVAIGLGGQSELGGIHQYACGENAFHGNEGTWRDAEDGHLNGHPIAQGLVDSAFCLEFELVGQGSESFHIFVQGGSSSQVLVEGKSVARNAPLDASRNYLLECASSITKMFPHLAANHGHWLTSCMAVLLHHQDSGGAIMASLDSDILRNSRAHYNYCWTRDGCRIAEVMLDLGWEEPVERFLGYCMRISDRFPAFRQKYTVDGHLGASWHPKIKHGVRMNPIQIDETAEVVSLAARWIYDNQGSKESQQAVQTQLVNPYLEWLLSVSSDPLSPSALGYDLWEERYGWHTYSQWTVVKACRAVAKLEGLGNKEWIQRAEDLELGLRSRVQRHPNGGLAIARTIYPHQGENEQDCSPDASLLTIWNDLVGSENALQDLEAYCNPIRVHSHVGGLARYPGDWYFRSSDAYPGNPWVITTLWESNVKFLLAQSAESLQETASIFDWLSARLYGASMLAEQYHPDSGEPLSVGPLVWSHAEALASAMLFESTMSKFKS